MKNNRRLLIGGCYGIDNLDDAAIRIALDNAFKENGVSQRVFLVATPLGAFVCESKAVVGGAND